MAALTTSIIIGASIAAAGAVGAAAIASSQQKKAAENAAELAREQQQSAQSEQRRLEEKFGLTPGELAREQRLLGIPQGEEAIKFVAPGLEEKRQLEVERRAGLPGEELLREEGPATRALLDKIASRFGMTGEELFKAEGVLPRQLAEQAVSGEPTAMFAPELELARQMVNQEANRRGVFGGLPEGGIRFENLGRAGVDLAIKSARERLAQQNALASAYLSLGQGTRAEAGTVAERALSVKERARAELDQFLFQTQGQSAAAKGRATQAGIGAAGVLQPQVAQTYQNLQGLEGYKGGIQGPAEAGLSAIGQIGADYLGYKLPSIGATPSTLGELRTESAKYDPILALEEKTGRASLAGQESDYLRKRYPGLYGNF